MRYDLTSQNYYTKATFASLNNMESYQYGKLIIWETSAIGLEIKFELLNKFQTNKLFDFNLGLSLNIVS